jgi:PAS domain S-box-containing protein
MNYDTRTREQLIEEIKHLRQRLKDLETSTISLTNSMSSKINASKIIDSILNTLPDSALILNGNAIITNYNTVAKQILCMNFDKIFGRKITEFFPSESARFLMQTINKILLTGIPENFEEERDGRIFDITIYPIMITNNEIERLAFFARDITNKKKIEESEYKKSLQLEQLLKTAQDLTSSMNMDEILRRIAAAAKDILHSYGCSIYLLNEKKDKLIPKVVIDPLYEEEIMATPVDVEGSFTGMAVKAKKSLLFNNTADSGGFQIPGTSVLQNERIIVTPFIIEGEVIGAMTLNKIGPIFTEDDLSLAETFGAYAVTTIKTAKLINQLQDEIEIRKNAEKELNNNKEHLKLINRILRHDIINNLSKIHSALRLYQRTSDKKYLNEIKNNLDNSFLIIEKMKNLEDYFHSNKIIQIYNLKDTIRNIAKNFKDISITIEGDADVFANESIYSIFENLFRKAIEHGKADSIQVKIIDHEKTVNVYVADNGKGIEDSLKEKIFDEGFTKGNSENTGLGLYIVKKALNSFGGNILVKDNDPKGALFILIFNKKA